MTTVIVVSSKGRSDLLHHLIAITLTSHTYFIITWHIESYTLFGDQMGLFFMKLNVVRYHTGTSIEHFVIYIFSATKIELYVGDVSTATDNRSPALDQARFTRLGYIFCPYVSQKNVPTFFALCQSNMNRFQ